MAQAPEANALIEFFNKTELKFEDMKRNSAEELPEITPQDLSGKIVVITGANVGIGYETAKSLATMNPQLIILACRNLQKAKEASAKIKEATKFERLEEWELDLASFASVRAFVKRFLDSGMPLDLLVSNAGVGSPTFVETQDGLEVVTQVNHLSNMLLVFELTPAIHKANGRIVIVASDTHFWSPLTPEDPNPVRGCLAKPAQDSIMNAMKLYHSSKLFNILFAQEYARRCPYPIWICAANPGYTESELQSKHPLTGQPNDFQRSGFLKKRTTYNGAKSIIHAAITPNLGEKAIYISEMRPSRVRSTTTGDVGQKWGATVWKESLEVLKEHSGVTKFESWVEK